jgi:hypothetical protein
MKMLTVEVSITERGKLVIAEYESGGRSLGRVTRKYKPELRLEENFQEVISALCAALEGFK